MLKCTLNSSYRIIQTKSLYSEGDELTGVYCSNKLGKFKLSFSRWLDFNSVQIKTWESSLCQIATNCLNCGKGGVIIYAIITLKRGSVTNLTVMNLNQIDDDSPFSCHIYYQSNILIWNTNLVRVPSSTVVIFTVKGTNEASVRPHLYNLLDYIAPTDRRLGKNMMMMFIHTHVNFPICKWSF